MSSSKLPKQVDKDRVQLVIDKYESVTMTNMMPMVVDLMQIVRDIPNLRGSEKKAIVIDCLKFIVDETDAGSWDKYDAVVKELIPIVIDSLIEVNKGKLLFKNPVQGGCCI